MENKTLFKNVMIALLAGKMIAFISVFNLTDQTTFINKTGMNLPEKIFLEQNYPNPFNPSTTIGYQISESSNVRIKIYDTLGQEVKTLVDSFQSAGRYSISWNATDNSSNPVSSGIYFYRIETQNSISGRKMVLVQ